MDDQEELWMGDARPERSRPRRLPRPMPESVKAASDRIEPALWLGRRIKRFAPLVQHRLFPQIYGKLIAGQSVYRVTEWVQEQVSEDDPLATGQLAYMALARRLYRFRKLLPDGAVLAHGYLAEKFQALDAGIDLNSELDQLIRYQKARIEAKAEAERDFPVPLEQMGREVDRLRELLAEKRATQQIYGLIPGAPRVTPTTAVNVNVGISEQSLSIAAFMQANPSKVPDVVSLIQQLDALADEHAGGRRPGDSAE